MESLHLYEKYTGNYTEKSKEVKYIKYFFIGGFFPHFFQQQSITHS